MRFELEMTPELRRTLEGVAASAIRVANVTMRALSTRDLAGLDAFMLANGCRPANGIEWRRVDLTAATGLNLYALGRAAAPELAAGMVATIARNVSSKWSKERWDIGVYQTRSPPHYKKGAPFPLRAQDFDLVYDASTKSAKIRTALLTGHKRFELAINTHDAKQRAVLESITTEWKHGNAAIEQDRLRPWKWYARISYTRFVPIKLAGISAAMHRGIRNFLVLVAETGEPWKVEGADIESFLKQVQTRRRSYQRQIKSSSRTGRGRTRALEPIKKLEDKATRWRRTHNQTIARRAADWLRANNVCTLFLEDLSGIRDGEPERLEGGERIWRRVQEWPYFDLGTRLESCCEEYGISVVVLPPHYISQRCPACGHTSIDNRDLARWKIRCVACAHVVDLDIGAGQNLLARGLAPPSAQNNDLPPNDPPPSSTTRKSPKKRTSIKRSPPAL